MVLCALLGSNIHFMLAAFRECGAYVKLYRMVPRLSYKGIGRDIFWYMYRSGKQLFFRRKSSMIAEEINNVRI